MPGKPLTAEQNERARTYLRELLAKHDNKQSVVAPMLGVRQPTLSGFLTGRQGTSYPIVERLAAALHIDEREILGKGQELSLPRTAEGSRKLAADLAKQHSVHVAAIQSVMGDEITPEQQRWSVLQWTDQIRWRERELLDRAHGAAPREIAPAAEPKPRRSRRSA